VTAPAAGRPTRVGIAIGVPIGLAAPLVLLVLAVAALGAPGDAAAAGSSFGPSASGSPLPSAPPACDRPLQAIVDAAAAGDTVTLPACTSTAQLRIDRSLTVQAAGTWIDGGGTLDHAVLVTADDVVLSGITVTDVANPPQDGAIRAWDVDRFMLRDALVTGAAGACVSVARSAGSSLVDSTFRGCGQEGIHATEADGLAVTGDRIEGNNPVGSFDPEWEAGGAKVTRSRGVTFSDNDVTGNHGPGIWCDIDCRDLVVRDNRVASNDRAGIQVEISDGALVTGNAAWDNGWAKPTWGWGAGILVSSSRRVRVEGNVLAWNADGIVVVSQDRSDAPATIDGDTTAGNVVATQAGFEAYGLAWLMDWSGPLLDPANGNGGSGDRFIFDRPEDGTGRFAWGGAIGSLDAFEATPGGRGATYVTAADLGVTMAASGIPASPIVGHTPAGPSARALVGPVLSLLGALLAVLAVAAVALRRRRSAAARHQAEPQPDPQLDEPS
jgi:nitrous oxidase accessory protein NosD